MVEKRKSDPLRRLVERGKSWESEHLREHLKNMLRSGKIESGNVAFTFKPVGEVHSIEVKIGGSFLKKKVFAPGTVVLLKEHTDIYREIRGVKRGRGLDGKVYPSRTGEEGVFYLGIVGENGQIILAHKTAGYDTSKERGAKVYEAGSGNSWAHAINLEFKRFEEPVAREPNLKLHGNEPGDYYHFLREGKKFLVNVYGVALKAGEEWVRV